MKTIAFYILLISSIPLLSSCARRVPVGGYYPYGQSSMMVSPGYGRGYYNPYGGSAPYYGYRNYSRHGNYRMAPRERAYSTPNYGHHGRGR